MQEAVHSIRVRLDSVEELSHALQGSVWDLDMRQLETGRAPVAIDAVATSSSLLMKTGLQGRTHQLGSLAANTYTFGLPAHTQQAIKFGSRHVGSDTLTLFDSGGALDCVSEAGFAAYTVSITAADFESVIDSLGLDLIDFCAGCGSRHVNVSSNSAQTLRRYMQARLDASPTTIENEPALQDSFQKELTIDLATTFAASTEPVSGCFKNRARALREALRFIHAHTDERITVEQICQHAACSISTLERAFRESFAMSPKRYLMAIRLSGMRKALLTSTREESVGDIAARLGFWHMSKMAADYKRMFGELPSHTRSKPLPVPAASVA